MFDSKAAVINRSQQKSMRHIAILTGLTLLAGAAFQSSANAADLAKAKVIYDKQCAKCHAKDGTGKTKMGQKLKAKDYTKAEVQAKMKDDKAFKVIKEGLKQNGKTLMKPTKGVTDAQIKDLIAYMRKFKKS